MFNTSYIIQAYCRLVDAIATVPKEKTQESIPSRLDNQVLPPIPRQSPLLTVWVDLS